MSDNVPISSGSGTTIAADEVTDATLGLSKVQFVKVMDGTLDSTNKMVVNSAGEVGVSGITNTVAVYFSPSNPSVSASFSAASLAIWAGNSTGSLGGTFYVSLATQIAGEDITNDLLKVTGNIAHGSADANNPLKVGYKALASPKGVTLASDANRINAVGDLDGMLMQKPLTAFGDIITERQTNVTGASTAFSNFSAVANTRNYLTSLTVYNESATASYLDLKDGTSGSVLYTIPLPTLGGAVVTFPVPFRQTTANTALAYKVNGALSTIYISAVGFQSKL